MGVLTGVFGLVATPQITHDVDLDKRAMDVINHITRKLRHPEEVDAAMALLRADVSVAADIGRDVNMVYIGHNRAIKRGATVGDAPTYETGSFRRNIAIQDLTIAGTGRRVTVRVADVNFSNDTSHTAVDGVLDVDGFSVHPAQAVWISADAEEGGEVSRIRHIYQASTTYANHTGNTVIGTLASGVNFDEQGSDRYENTISMLVADANRELVMRHVYVRNHLPVIGFSNSGSLRVPRPDTNGNSKVAMREVGSLMALQFKAAHETLAGCDVKRVLVE